MAIPLSYGLATDIILSVNRRIYPRGGRSICKFIDPNGKDLTSKFMQFAEDFLASKKGDPQHNPTINSCLVRIPGTINSKCTQEVKVIQRWDGQRLAINYLLRDFRRWLIDEQMKLRLIDSKRARTQTVNPKTISWIEKLLQTPIDDYRKFVVWRILSPYLINIRKCSVEEATNMIKNWLDKCSKLRPLDLIPIMRSKIISNPLRGTAIYQ